MYVVYYEDRNIGLLPSIFELNQGLKLAGML